MNLLALTAIVWERAVLWRVGGVGGVTRAVLSSRRKTALRRRCRILPL